jgi:DnaK suppressor protein
MKHNKHEATGDRSHEIAAYLRERRRELLSECDQCRAELQLDTHASLDEEDATERACSAAAEILEHLQSELRDIDQALEYLQEGRYGRCIDCGARIPSRRLRAMPTARRCLSCQAGSERKAG